MTLLQVPFGHALVNRVEPLMPPQAYKTYGMSMPLRTHWRPATCEETDCEAYRFGWVSTFDLGTELGQKQYHYCTHDRERRYHVQRVSLTLVKVVYGPGNRCFRSGEHRVPLERLPVFTVAPGDWRARTGQPRVHKRPEDWTEDFSVHQDRLATAVQRG